MKIKSILFVTALLSAPFFCEAQTQQDVMQQTAGTDPFTVVEKMPVYPGGQEQMFKFMATNLHYPESARTANLQGVVFISFVVEADGAVSNAKVIRGLSADCDAEALRVVNLMPKWTPGEQDGKKVKVAYNLPIRFALN